MRSRRALARLLAAALGGAVLAGPSPVAAVGASLTQAYEIVATLDVDAARLDAVETLTVTNRAPTEVDVLDLSVIPRALGYLAVEPAVTVDDRPAATEWTTGTNLRVALPTAIRRGESATVRVEFALQVGSSAPPFTARLSVENGVLSFGHWFPIVSSEHDVYGIGDPQVTSTAERISLDLTTIQPLPRDAVACPGLVQAPEQSGTRWRCESELVRDFSFVVNPRFRLTTREAGGVQLRVYTETVDGGVTADLAATALTRLEEAFGEYPWSDLVLAEIGGGGGFSMEYPRAIHLTRTKVTDTYVIYHEVAHQWFYAQLGNDQQRDPWLDEGFADFSARWLMGIGEQHCSTRPIDSTVFDWPAGPISGGDWTSCDGYFHAVFDQSTEFINQLRGAMGDDRFFRAMRDFFDRYRFRVVSDPILLGFLARRSPVDLEPIYERYLSGRASSLPPVAPNPSRGGSGGTFVR